MVRSVVSKFKRKHFFILLALLAIAVLVIVILIDRYSSLKNVDTKVKLEPVEAISKNVVYKIEITDKENLVKLLKEWKLYGKPKNLSHFEMLDNGIEKINFIIVDNGLVFSEIKDKNDHIISSTDVTVSNKNMLDVKVYLSIITSGDISLLFEKQAIKTLYFLAKFKKPQNPSLEEGILKKLEIDFASTTFANSTKPKFFKVTKL